MPYRAAMLVHTIPASLALVGGGAVAWNRRKTWRLPYDRSVTLAVVVLAVSFALMIPIQHYYLGKLLTNLAGISHIRSLIGHILIIVSIGALIHAAACRLMPDDQIDHFMRVRVELPSFAGALGMLVTFMASDQLYPSDDWEDMMDIPTGGSLKTYWAVLALTTGYLLTLLIRLMLILRRDCRSHVTATLIIAGAGCGLLLPPTWIISSSYEMPNEIAWLGECSMALLWIAAAGVSCLMRRRYNTERKV